MRLPSLLGLVLLTPLLRAQLYVVDPIGGGTHNDLQTAIDAAPPGAVIHVRGGTWGPLVVTRSLTLVGENMPLVRSTLTGVGQQPPAIQLQGSGGDTALLVGFEVRGDANGFAWNVAGPGLAASGFARIAIHDSIVRGHVWSGITGAAAGASGITVTGAATVHVVRSMVRASTSFAGSMNQWAPNGAAAIDAPLANVMLLDATVTGGDADVSWWTMGSPWPTPCPCTPGGTAPGRGGDGVVAHHVYRAGGAITAGLGSPVRIGVPPVPYGAQPAGATIAAVATTGVAPTLSPTSALRLGATHTIAFPATSTPSLLALGAPLAWPVPVLGMPHWCLDLAQPFVLNFLPAGSTALAMQVPNAVQLLGYELGAQRADVDASGAFTATNPTFALVQP
jgi:hypothetical protein